jgi:hypothetical protein
VEHPVPGSAGQGLTLLVCVAGGALKRTPQQRYIVVEGTSLAYFKDFKTNPDGSRAKSQGVLR